MTKYLRSHPYLTLLVSSVLILAGAGVLFVLDPDYVSDAGTMLPFGGFLAFCVGMVGLMIVIFQPLALTRDAAADWEIVRLEGKGRFIRRFLLGASPLLIGILAPVVWNEDFDSPASSFLQIGLLATVLFVTTIAIAFRFWNHLGHQHSVASAGENAGLDGADPDKNHDH